MQDSVTSEILSQPKSVPLPTSFRSAIPASPARHRHQDRAFWETVLIDEQATEAQDRLDIQMDVQSVLRRLNPDLRAIAERLMNEEPLTAAQEARLPELRAVFAEVGLQPETRYPRSEPAGVYHTKARDFLSSHRLGDFRKCPLLYHRKQTGLIPDVDTDAYLVGRAAHTLILEGQELLAEGKPEQVARATYCDVPSQTRTDWLHPNRGFVDLKTCDDLTWFESDARRYGYAHQLAFYRAVLGLVLGATLPVWLIAVEKKEPHRCGVWRVDPEVLDQAQRENEAAIERLKQCRRRNAWPTGYEEVRVFDYV